MTLDDLIEEELRRRKEDNDLRKVAKAYNDLHQEKLENGILYTSNYDIDLSDSKYKDIHTIYFYDFSKEGLDKVIQLRDDLNILIKFPVIFDTFDINKTFVQSEKYKKVFFVDENDSEKKFSINDLRKIDELMDLMVKDIKMSNLSPYEKYIAIYDIVKSYKPYKEGPGIINTASRNEYLFILSDYAVCVGYVKFLNILLSKVGILSDDLLCQNNHDIAITYIEDPKYGIDSYQLCDPTNDAIKDDYKQKPLIEGYRFLNMTLEEAMEHYKEIDLYPFFYEVDPVRMLRMLQLQFGKKKMKLAFNRHTRSNSKTSILNIKDDEVMNIFKPLIDTIGLDKDKYSLQTANDVIEYLVSKTEQVISYDYRMMAIYNVNKFINNNQNDNFADFVINNFSFKTQITDRPLKLKDNILSQINDLELEEVVNLFYHYCTVYENVNSLFTFSKENFANIMFLHHLESELYGIGVVPFRDILILSNSLFENKDNISQKCNENGLEYDPDMNALYLVLNENISHMKFSEFKQYLNNLVNNLNSKKK